MGRWDPADAEEQAPTEELAASFLKQVSFLMENISVPSQDFRTVSWAFNENIPDLFIFSS